MVTLADYLRACVETRLSQALLVLWQSNLSVTGPSDQSPAEILIKNVAPHQMTSMGAVFTKPWSEQLRTIKLSNRLLHNWSTGRRPIVQRLAAQLGAIWLHIPLRTILIPNMLCERSRVIVPLIC